MSFLTEFENLQTYLEEIGARMIAKTTVELRPPAEERLIDVPPLPEQADQTMTIRVYEGGDQKKRLILIERADHTCEMYAYQGDRPTVKSQVDFISEFFTTLEQRQKKPQRVINRESKEDE